MDKIKDLIEKIGLPRFITILMIAIGTLVFFTYLTLRTVEPEMGLLFSQVDPGDSSKILEKLKILNIPTEIRGDGEQIYVPVENISKLRMELASEGLPAGGTIGYELFDKTDVLGTTHALMDINFLRATEGEIAKSVRTIQGVQSARVHLVIPKKELFSSEKLSPSASIMLKMKGTSRLSVNQVLAIQHLVASAVPSLSLDKISIIDDKGTLLAKGQDGSLGGDTVGSQQETRHLFEHKIASSIESMLERTIGPGKIHAEVSAEIDFDKVTATSVEFNPEGQVARSTQSITEGSATNEASSSDSVSVQNVLPEGATTGQPGSQSKNQDNRSEESSSFEISNTTRTYIKESGGIKRLSIAVLVDGSMIKNKDGKDVYTPRSEKELKQIEELVKTAVGFQEKRGDTVKIVNMKFDEVPEVIENITFVERFLKIFLRPKVIDSLVLSVIALIFFFSVIRPTLFKIIKSSLQLAQENYSKNLSSLLDQSQEDENSKDEDKIKIPKNTKFDETIHMQNIEGQMSASAVKKIGEIVEKYPEETITILRSWMYSS